MKPAEAVAATESSNAWCRAEGYAVFRNLVPHDLIDDLLGEYRRVVVPSRKRFFRQNGNQWARNKLNVHGHVTSSFLDVHDYRDPEFRRFSTLTKSIFLGPAVLEALAGITQEDGFKLMQSMLFDANTETPPHQDYWYLDSAPAGRLLAGWFALEDIDERAGRFYVMRQTNRSMFGVEGEDIGRFDTWIHKARTHFANHRDAVFAPDLRKGDVMFWSSRLIHGALETRDRRFSRKSLTAHYMPADCLFGNAFGAHRKQPEYGTFNGTEFRRNLRRASPGSIAATAIVNAVEKRPTIWKAARAARRLIRR